MSAHIRPRTLAAICVAGGAVMGATVVLASAVGGGLPVAPLAASVALAVGTPHVPAARPHRIFGAHAACVLCGTLAAALLGHGTPAIVAAGVLALAVTLGLRLAQPPAVATALVVAGGAFAVADLLWFVALSALVALGVEAVNRARHELRAVTA